MLTGPRANPRRGQLPNVQAPPDQLIPFVLPPSLPATQNVHCGFGMICPISNVTANTTYLLTHGLGRQVQIGWCVSAGINTYPPRLRFEAGGTQNVQPIQLEGNVVSGFVVVF